MARIDELLAARERIEAKLDHILARPMEPVGDADGCNVVWMQVQYPTGPVVYTYGAIQARGKWYLTGRNAAEPYTWDELWDWLEQNNINIVSLWHATHWEEVQ